MNLDDFDYRLPRSMIAQSPRVKRSASRLMVLNSGIAHDSFENLSRYLSEGDVLVLNDSRVINARLVGKKETGGGVELLLLECSGKEAFCLIRGKNIRVGTNLQIGDVTSEVTNKEKHRFKVVFDRNTNEVIERYGQVPLPHYIKEELDDPIRYQTVYAKRDGSVAAPTAGLHFTEALLESLIKKGVKIAHITLHIGPSTFLPIRDVSHSDMTPEYFSIDRENAKVINEGIENRSIIPVGTSSVKALESAAVDGRVIPTEDKSSLFITPGYRFKLHYKGMVTNFHLPRSTLLLLVSALFGREKILQAYSEAVIRRYRFYSFGDAMLIRR